MLILVCRQPRIRSRNNIAEVDEEADDIPFGFIFGTTNEVAVAASASREPPKPILIGVESSSSHNDCVSFDAKDTLSDVSPSPAVSDTAISSNLLMTSPHGGPEDVDETRTSLRGNHSKTIGDVHPPQKDSIELVIAREGIVDGTLGGLNDIPLSAVSLDSFSIDYISEKMKDLPLPVEALALFDALHLDVGTSPYSDLGHPPDGQGFKESSTVQQPPTSSSFISMNPMAASKIAHAIASFNPSGDLVSWRGFQISSSSQESLERLLAQFPQILDRLIIKTASAQTFFLYQLAGLVLRLHTLSLYSLRVEDLKKFSDDVDDLEAVAVDMSPFRARLDLLKSSFNLVALRSEVAVRKCEDESFSVQLPELDEAANKLKIQPQDLEDNLLDLEAKLQDVECQRRDLESTT